MVGEGVLLECLETAAVEKVLSVSRKPVNHEHPKLEQLLVPDFRNTSDVEAKLTGYDACFYCAGVSSIGMSEADYTAITYDTPVAFATTLARLNPTMVFVYVTGARTDSAALDTRPHGFALLGAVWAPRFVRSESSRGRLVTA